MREFRASRLATAARRLLRDPRGATAVEYGLIVACIVIVMVVSLHGLAEVTTGMWNSVADKVVNAN